MNDQWIEQTWEKIDQKLAKVAIRNASKLPYTTVNGTYDDYTIKDVNWWTNGFWPGMMWLMYIGTQKELYKEVAENGEILLDKALENYEALHHDVGFMWHISSGVNYRVTGNKQSKVRNMFAANVLAGRFNLKGQYIKAWDDWGGESHIGWSIIDCMMNISLLYWASKESNDPRFSYIAEAHADMTKKDHVREDGSVKHIVIHDVTGKGIIGEERGQGYEEGSSWSRGQAWALYGFALSYIHTGKQEYLDTAKKIAHYFIAAICEDWLPKCDFRSPQEPIIIDSTAGAIAACGLIEIANSVGEFEKSLYNNGAIKILKALEQHCCNWQDDEDSILQRGTERYHSEHGRHIPIIYGDYYFVEAFYKLMGNKLLFW